LATVLCGQVLEEPLKEKVAAERARSIGVMNVEGYLRELATVPLMTRQRLLDVANFMSVITKTISELALGKYQLHKHSQDYLNRLINSVSDCIISANADGIIAMINESGARMFGSDKAELIGESISRLFSGTTPRESPLEQADPDPERKWRQEMTAVRADKESFPVQVSISGINPEDKENADYVAVIRDISEEKRIERMKEDLMGMITHDLRNPVLSIQKAMQLLVDESLGPLNPSQMEVMRLALGTSHQLYGMANDLLDIYRSESGQFLLIRSPFDLNRIIKQSIDQLEFFVKDKRAAVCFDTSKGSLRLYGDQKRLLRVCVNLLDNAIKYSPEGGEIRVATTQFQGGDGASSLAPIPEAGAMVFHPGQPYIMTTVSDQGVGIPEEYKRVVFDKFFKIKSQDHEGRKGVGLGLAFCKQVIEAHGGFIWAESPIGQDKSGRTCGCEFCFILPKGPIIGG
jgi:PAS domain S-box-containing protein